MKVLELGIDDKRTNISIDNRLHGWWEEVNPVRELRPLMGFLGRYKRGDKGNGKIIIRGMLRGGTKSKYWG